MSQKSTAIFNGGSIPVVNAAKARHNRALGPHKWSSSMHAKVQIKVVRQLYYSAGARGTRYPATMIMDGF